MASFEEKVQLQIKPYSTPPPPSSSSWTSSLLTIWAELKHLLRLCGPMIFVNIFVAATQVSSVIFVGHLDALSLARATVATSFSNVIGISVVFGMATALDTLCGQAYGGKKYELLGFYLQQGIIGLNACAVVLAVVYAFVGDILLVMGQERELAVGAGYYMRWLIPGLFGMATSQCFVRYFLSQSLVLPVFLCALATIVWHLTLCYVLLYVLAIGYHGAALTASSSLWVFSILLALTARFSKSWETCGTRWSWEVLKEMKSFFQLAIPSAAMICLEWWCYEILVLVAGFLPNPELEASTLSICVNTAGALIQIPQGIGIGASIRVSNELGRGNIVRARRAVKVAVGLALAEALIVSIVLGCIHDYMGLIFSSDAAVIASVSTITPLLSINVFFDATQGTLSGVARGCGIQKVGALINLGSYYILGLPLGCLLAFLTPLGGKGLWVAAIVAPFAQASSLALLVGFANWDRLVANAVERMMASVKEPLLIEPKRPELC